MTLHKDKVGSLDLNGVSILCSPKSKIYADFEKLLPQCLESSVITAKSVSLPPLLDALRDMGVEDQLAREEDFKQVSNGLKISIENGKFDFVMNLQSPILKKYIKFPPVTANGEIKLDEKTNIVRLRIDDARIHKFNLVRFIPGFIGALFPKEVIRVDGAYIYVSLNDIQK